MKSVLITGASSGLGASMASEAAQRGWKVLVGYHRGRERAEGLVRRLASAGGQARPVELSLEDPAQISGALEALAGQGETLEAAILNASPAPGMTPFLKTTAEQMLEHWRATVLGNQALIAGLWKRFFRSRRGGQLLGILSMASQPPVRAQMTAYVVAKRGLEALLDCALAEFGGDGLRASALFPDFTETPMLEGFHPHVLEMARARQPGGKFLDPAAVARKALDILESPPNDARLALHSMPLAQAPFS